MSIILDDSHLQRVLNNAARHLTNTALLMNDISRALMSETMMNFQLRGRPAWAGLSPTTLARRKYGGNAILQDSGELKRSINIHHTTDTASVGTNLIYAATQQFGANMGQYGSWGKMPIPWGDIPARPFIPMDKNGDISYQGFLAVSEVVNGYLAGAFG